MSNFFEETMQGLQEAVAIEKGEIPPTEKRNMSQGNLQNLQGINNKQLHGRTEEVNYAKEKSE